MRVQSRLVLEDVLVTDAQGKPVEGLSASAFHVLDNGKPQALKSFEEGTPLQAGASAPEPPLPPGVFSSAPRQDAPGTSEVLLIDADDLNQTDQMFLLDQLRRALAAMPAGLQAALLQVTNGRTVPIRGFTTDRADLRRALEECLPVQPHAIESKFQSAVDQLVTVAAYLEQVPGRKNVLWFAGAFPLVAVADQDEAASGVAVDSIEKAHIIRQVHEALAEARVSVYPVDVRGVITYGMAPPLASGGGTSETHDMAAATRRRVVEAPAGANDFERRDAMRQLAEATGGKAYMGEQPGGRS